VAVTPGPEWQKALEAHNADPYAHNSMTTRLIAANTTLLAARVTALETFRDESREAIASIPALQRFRQQATVLGGIGFLVLGAVVTALANRLFAGHGL
jgi:hypothetical protein